MAGWPDKLFVYEINTWVWLSDLSKQFNRPITLDNIPDEALDTLAKPHIDMIWLMGIWKRSAFSRRHALKYKHEYLDALPDLTDSDVIGSAYAIADYEVDSRLGGRAGLAALRLRLRERGVQLMLDFVPNHVAVDHPWVREQPDFIVQGMLRDARQRPGDFFRRKDSHNRLIVLAHGRDPYFPGWSDTAQLNAFNPELRKAVVETLLDIASQCDGVRCDMAMLMFNEIFRSTWAGYVETEPKSDYWPSIIPKIKAKYPDFMFVAEVYWNREYEILQQGFDFAYDKLLYDRIIEGDIQHLRAHLVASLDYQKHMMRFLENHDELRAFDRLGHYKSFPAATLICTLPGACLLHDGQFAGRMVKLPVQIRRQPDEPTQQDVYDYYLRLLQETRDPIYQQGEWYLFDLITAGNGDGSHKNLLAYGWRFENQDYRLVVVNLTPIASVARLPLGFWSEVGDYRWKLFDVDDGRVYRRVGKEMVDPGLFIELKPFESHIFRFERVD